MVSWLIRILAFIALGISGYLAGLSLLGEKYPGCGGLVPLDCEHVLSSRWSHWLGIPVGLLSVSVYAVILVCSLMRRQQVGRGNSVLVFASLLAAGAALWFVGLQLFVIEKVCLYCLACHTCGAMIAAIVVWQAIRGNPLARQIPASQSGSAVFTSASMRRGESAVVSSPSEVTVPFVYLFPMAAIGVLGLVFGQVLVPPKSFEIVTSAALANGEIGQNPTDAGPGHVTNELLSHTEPPRGNVEPAHIEDLEVTTAPGATAINTHVALRSSGNNDPPSRQPGEKEAAGALAKSPSATTVDTQDATAAGSSGPNGLAESRKERKIPLPGGTFFIDTYANPLLGSPEAKHVVIKFFDYTCPQCRQLHQRLERIRTRYGHQLAIAVLPIPLDSRCNPHVRYTHPKHQEDCHYTRLALAVWHLDPSGFEDYHQWLMEGKDPPSLADAVRRARQRFGAEAVNSAVNDAAVIARMKRYVTIYGIAGGPLPLLMVEDNLIKGVPTQATLYDFFERRLALKPVVD